MDEGDVKLGLDAVVFLQLAEESSLTRRGRAECLFEDIEDLSFGEVDRDVFERLWLPSDCGLISLRMMSELFVEYGSNLLTACGL